MNNLLNKLEMLNNINHNWINIVREEIENNGKASIPEMPKAYNELWNTLRDSLKENREETIKFFIKTVGDDGAWILKDVEESLKIYFDFSHLRELGRNSSDMATNTLDYLLENAVFYYDPQFANNYYRFKYESRKQIIDNAKALDALVTYYVGHHYTKNAIKNDMSEETGLLDSVCDYVAEQICKNYQMLQMNFIMNMMSSEQ